MKRRFRAATLPRRFRRQSHWAVMLGTALAASTTAGVQQAAAAGASGASRGAQASGTAAQDSRQLQFQIAAGPLDVAVAEYQRVTGLKVSLSDPRIGSVQSSGAAFIFAYTCVRYDTVNLTETEPSALTVVSVELLMQPVEAKPTTTTSSPKNAFFMETISLDESVQRPPCGGYSS